MGQATLESQGGLCGFSLLSWAKCGGSAQTLSAQASLADPQSESMLSPCPSASTLLPTWETLLECLAPGFSLVKPLLFQPFGKRTRRYKISLSPPPVSAFQRNNFVKVPYMYEQANPLCPQVAIA